MKTYTVENLISCELLFSMDFMEVQISVHSKPPTTQSMCNEITDDLPIRTSILDPMFEVKQNHFT